MKKLNKKIYVVNLEKRIDEIENSFLTKESNILD